MPKVWTEEEGQLSRYVVSLERASPVYSNVNSALSKHETSRVPSKMPICYCKCITAKIPEPYRAGSELNGARDMIRNRFTFLISTRKH